MKINVHKAASYSRLLEKCTNAVWENPAVHLYPDGYSGDGDQ